MPAVRRRPRRVPLPFASRPAIAASTATASLKRGTQCRGVPRAHLAASKVCGASATRRRGTGAGQARRRSGVRRDRDGRSGAARGRGATRRGATRAARRGSAEAWGELTSRCAVKPPGASARSPTSSRRIATSTRHAPAADPRAPPRHRTGVLKAAVARGEPPVSGVRPQPARACAAPRAACVASARRAWRGSRRSPSPVRPRPARACRPRSGNRPPRRPRGPCPAAGRRS
jgi:hypothetical protein